MASTAGWIANARMYAVAPAAAAAWRRLFEQVAAASGIALTIIDHAFPAPLAELWTRGDLGCAFICGLPFAGGDFAVKPVAAPIPAGARYGGRPVYVTDLLARSDAGYHRLEDSFGGRIGYTVADSHSGCNAIRHHLLAWRTPERPRLYRASVGPLVTPRKVVAALQAGEIDVGPLDGYALDLLRRHDPQAVAGLSVIATTPSAPIPLLVASPACPDAEVARLRDALVGLAGEAAGPALLADLCLAGFAPVAVADYAEIRRRQDAALAAGYPLPA